MGAKKAWLDLGAVVVLIASPTRVVLIMDRSFVNPKWKLPGGGIEIADQNVVNAAVREAQEETGILLSRERVILHSVHRRVDGVYYPHLCVALVTEEELDTRRRVGNEDGHPVKVQAFARMTALTTTNMLERHKIFLQIGLATH